MTWHSRVPSPLGSAAGGPRPPAPRDPPSPAGEVPSPPTESGAVNPAWRRGNRRLSRAGPGSAPTATRAAWMPPPYSSWPLPPRVTPVTGVPLAESTLGDLMGWALLEGSRGLVGEGALYGAGDRSAPSGTRPRAAAPPVLLAAPAPTLPHLRPSSRLANQGPAAVPLLRTEKRSSPLLQTPPCLHPGGWLRSEEDAPRSHPRCAPSPALLSPPGPGVPPQWRERLPRHSRAAQEGGRR